MGTDLVRLNSSLKGSISCSVGGPRMVLDEMQGTFTNKNTGKRRQIMYQRSPEDTYGYQRVRVGGISDRGRFIFDVFNSSELD